MTDSEQNRSTVVFFLFAGSLALILILFPFLEDGVFGYLATQFGLALGPDGSFSPTGEFQVGKMTETWFLLIANLLHIIKIILWMILIISIVRFVIKVISKTIYRDAAQGEVSSLVTTGLSIVIYIVSFFIVFQSQFPNVQLAPLFTGSTIIGIVVGLALQDTLGNLFAGIALQADQPFVAGDVIIIPGRGEGVVENVTWRGVKIRTFQNKFLVISNSVLGKETIEVAPKDNLNAKTVFFNTMYSKSPARTIQVVRDVVRQVENVSPKMRPVVRIRNLGDSAIEWEVKYWLEDYRMQHDTDALIRQRIWYVFQREKIDFAYPTRTLHIEPKPEEAPPEEVFTGISDRLSRVSIFAPLSDEEIERLASASTSRVYAPGEAIVRMGQVGNSMYVIIRGEVDIQIPELNKQRSVGKLTENDFFGEMSLLTGEPRTANVIAVGESEVLRIDKDGLGPIFKSNPTLVETISELIEERRIDLQQAEAESEDIAAENKKKGVMRSIRKFFGIR